MNFIDLFAGIGGFRYGLERANNHREFLQKEKGDSQVSTSSTRTKKGKAGFACIYSNEWNKYCAKIYQKNFDETPDTRDIRTVPSGEIPDHDLLCAGFPCQSFSIAGKRAGFEDTRGTLFFEIARIARDKRPRHLLLENVKGLLSHQAGQTFQTILGVLSGLGYRCEWQVLNSKNFGVPQNRERVFIVGHLGEGGGPQVFPVEESGKETLRKIEAVGNYEPSGYREGGLVVSPKGISPTMRGTRVNNVPQIKILVGGMLGNRVHSTEGLSPTISTPSGGRHLPMIANAVDCDAYLRTGRRKRVNGKAVLTSITERRIRRLTPTECERLQGFPDNWTEGVSDTQRYKMLGNAVTTNVVEAIGRRIRKVLNES